jgi:sulfide dehydrogenase cytochrome subunit
MKARLIVVMAGAVVTAGVLAGTGAAVSAEPPAGTSACSGCHADQAGVDTAVPRLAGRPAAYIVMNMQAFKAGKRPATVMERIAKGFSDAEVEAIAAWYAQQK